MKLALRCVVACTLMVLGWAFLDPGDFAGRLNVLAGVLLMVFIVWADDVLAPERRR